MNILVLGIGNLLLQDEGAGVLALEEFEKSYLVPQGVELLDGGTSGLELLYQLEGRDCLIILDVVKSGQPAGTVVRFEGDEVPALFRQKISPHQLGLSDLLATAQLTGGTPGKLVLLGIEPKDIGTGLEMSEEVEQAMEELVDRLARELAGLGLQLARREPQADREPLQNGKLATRTRLSWDGTRHGSVAVF
jgi:hydrogenase maturation protease